MKNREIFIFAVQKLKIFKEISFNVNDILIIQFIFVFFLKEIHNLIIYYNKELNF